MTAEAKHTPGQVSQLPMHMGDGYGWGGDWIVTFGGRSINLGAGQHDLAYLLAAAPDMLEALKALKVGAEARQDAADFGNVSSIVMSKSAFDAVLSAIAKAEGK